MTPNTDAPNADDDDASYSKLIHLSLQNRNQYCKIAQTPKISKKNLTPNTDAPNADSPGADHL